MPHPPKDIPKQQDKVTTAQVAAVNKQLKESVKSTDDLATNMKTIVKAFNEGVIQQEAFNDLLEEQIEKYSTAKQLAFELNEYAKDYTQTQKDNLANLDVMIAQEKAYQHEQRVGFSAAIAFNEKQTEFAREQNKIYVLQEQARQKTLERLNAQQTYQLNLITNSTDEEDRLAAIDEYIDKLKEEEQLEAEGAKAREKSAWAIFNIERARKAEARGDTAQAREIRQNINAPAAGYKYDKQKGIVSDQFNLFESLGDKVASKMGDKLDKFGLNLEKTSEKISKAIVSGYNSLNKMVENAATIYSNSYGRVNAAIDGAGKTFSDLLDGMQDIGVSTAVKQTDLLQNLTDVASQGISADLEQIALLATIKDKTVASFNSTDSNLRRLVRLNQNMGNLTAKQFGLAAVLRTELNQAFGDSSFIGRQFQALTGTLLDAVSANALKGTTDSTNFYAVMETFAAGMYEAGVDEGTVSAIAQGLNYLGSGNVQALSGNKSLQNLLLLSLDRADLDYATIMQQGLNTNDTLILLQSIVDYLTEITDNTKQNNVLQSSYANLFNLSITDMAAIRNLSQNSTFRNMASSSVYQTGEWTQNQAINEMLAVTDQRTTFAEALNNVIENAKFSLGVGVASSTWAYPLHLISKLGIDAGQTLTEVGLTKAGKATTIASAIGYAASLIPGVLTLVGDLTGNLNAIGNDRNTISNYFTANLGENGGIYAGGENGTRTPGVSTNFKGFEELTDNSGQTYTSKTQSTTMYSESNTWESEQAAAEVDPNTKILKEFEKTLMKAKEGEGYAFAVSLQGMSDGVLRSFASIFADEDAMMETLTGKNNALEKNNTFIDYVEDSSTKSNSAKVEK